jgi:two-component system, sensor histidine kinase and response regulator
MTTESAIASEGTILIIDDSPDNLRVLSKTLAIHRYNVRCVTNGSMAFVSIKNSIPDLILLDIRMPGMDGYEVCQQLKQNSITQDIPVIFLSALDDVQDIVKAFQVGGVDYITKPFQAEEVLARIRNQLTIQNLRKALSTQNEQLLQEIEERKKFEQALCQEIERRSLIETSLQDAKTSAEAANYAKSAFLAQMSHELRTPLNVILGFTTLIRGGTSLSGSEQEYLTKIDQSARDLLKLINDILAVTRAESSQLTLREQEFDLHYLFDSVISLWQPKALEKGLQFEFQRSSTVPQYVQSDESKLRQILMNLLENAVELTEAGSVFVRVNTDEQLSCFPDGTCGLVLEVQDTGTEVDFSEVNSIPQFIYPDGDNSKFLEELGLSLLLIQQYAQLMGGTVVLNRSHQRNVIRVHVIVQLVSSFSSSTQSGSSFESVMQSAAEEGTLTVNVLRDVMSPDWFVELHQAAVRGFDQQIIYLLKKIPSEYAVAAVTLETWTRNFQFDRIVELTQYVAST